VRAAPDAAPRAALAARAWQVARRSVAFAYYGLGGLAIATVVLPAQRRLARLRGDAEPPDLAAQRIAQRGSQSFIRLMERLGLLRVHWSGAERLRAGPFVVVANHPSLIDTPLLTSRMPQADFVVSPGWSENPFLRRAVAQTGYLRTDRGARALLREAVARLRAGRSVVIFAEGSRTPAEGLRPFQRGAAHIALASGRDLLPVSIRVAPRTLMKGQSWAHTPERTPEWHVEVGEPLRPAELVGAIGDRRLAAQRLTGILQDYFERRWRGGAS